MKPNWTRNTIKIGLLFIALTSIVSCGVGGGGSSSSTSKGGSTDTSITPTLTSVSSTYSSSPSTKTISGTCVNDTQVKLIGSSNAVTTCTNGIFSFDVTIESEGSYTFIIRAENLFTHGSATTSFNWLVDGTPPNTPVITTPTSNPRVSSNDSVRIDGTCETGATLSYAISGSANVSNTISCSTGSFSLTYVNSTNGTYNFSFLQTDLAGNQSPNVTFTWIKDSTVPAEPIIGNLSSTTHYQSAEAVTISGTCPQDDGMNNYTVYFQDYNASTTSTGDCSTGLFSFSLSKSTPAASTNAFNFGLSTVNETSGMESNTIIQTIVIDKGIPAAPMILNPTAASSYASSGNNITVSGSCEDNTTVTLPDADTPSITCANSVFSFTVAKTLDGDYLLSVKQTDQAGNESPTDSLTWQRQANLPETPTITVPSAITTTNNSGSFTISGTCTPGFTVTLTDSTDSSTTTQTCASSAGTPPLDGDYTFTITRSTDNSYGLTVKQTNLASLDSGSNSRTWVRDTSAPTITITVGPSSPNYITGVNFTVTSSEEGTVMCQLNSDTAVNCTPGTWSSPFSYATAISTSGIPHIMKIWGIDAAGNSGASDATKYDIHSWNHQITNAIALFDFETTVGAELEDISDNANDVTPQSGSQSAADKKYGSNSLLTDSTHWASISSAEQDNFGRIANPATFEFHYKRDSLASNTEYPLISKYGAAGTYGWEVGMRRTGGGSYRFYLYGSCDASVAPVRFSSPSNASDGTATWYHVAIVLDGNQVAFYHNGSSIGTTTISEGQGGCTAANGYKLTNASETLYLGRRSSASNAKFFYLDGIRISQTARSSGSFCDGATICPKD